MMIFALCVAIVATVVMVVFGYKYVLRDELDRAERAAQLETYCEGLYYEGAPRTAGGDGDEQS